MGEMKLYEYGITVLDEDGNCHVAWRVKCKPGFYYDFRDGQIKPESMPPIPGYKAPKKSYWQRFVELFEDEPIRP